MTIENHQFAEEQVSMLALRNRLHERGMDALLSGGEESIFCMCEMLIHRWVIHYSRSDY